MLGRPGGTAYPESVERACTVAGDAGEVSVCTEAAGAPGVTDTLVQERAWFHAASAAVAASPESGWGRSSTITAGRQVTWSMCRPVAEITSDPLAFSGGELS